MSLKTSIRGQLALALLVCTAAAGAQTTAPTALPDWVSWGKTSGAQHATDLLKRGLANNYVACGIRASLELASKVRHATDEQRTAFFDAFEAACTGINPASQVARQAAPEAGR